MNENTVTLFCFVGSILFIILFFVAQIIKIRSGHSVPDTALAGTTRTVIYSSVRSMESGIIKYESKGWSVMSTTQLKADYSCSKTCCLGFIFLPLALLGKKGDQYQVIYQKK